MIYLILLFIYLVGFGMTWGITCKHDVPPGVSSKIWPSVVWPIVVPILLGLWIVNLFDTYLNKEKAS